MKKHLTKIITGVVILAAIVSAVVLLQNQNDNSVPENANVANTNSAEITELSITTTIDYGETKSSYDKNVSSGSTALDVLNLISDEDGVELGTSESDYGVLINTIDSVGENTEDGKYWSFYVNDEMASVGVGDYTLSNHDAVTMKYQSF